MVAIAIQAEGGRMTGFEAWFAKWGWVVIGLTCGFAAKYALRIKRGQRVKPLQVFADVLLLPMVGLIAYTLVGPIGAPGEARAMFAGLCMVGADRLVAVMTDWWLGKLQVAALRDVNLELIDQSGQVRETLAKVDAARSLGAQQRGEAPPEGNDPGARLAHRLPPKKPD